MDRLTLLPLVANAAAGTSLAAGFKHFFGKDDWFDVAVQSGLIYMNHDGGPASAAMLTLWSAPVCYIGKVFSQAFVSAGLKEARNR